VVLGNHSVPLGWVTLLVTFGDASNYCMEMLAFEVVNFSSPYHVIHGRPCYVMFMAIPSYTYLKHKIPRPARVITIKAKAWQPLDCEQRGLELAAAAVAMAELRELSLLLAATPLSPWMPPTPGIFRTDKDARVVQIGIDDSTKTVWIGASLDPK
jgi:hypothetical protein